MDSRLPFSSIFQVVSSTSCVLPWCNVSLFYDDMRDTSVDVRLSKRRLCKLRLDLVTCLVLRVASLELPWRLMPYISRRQLLPPWPRISRVLEKSKSFNTRSKSGRKLPGCYALCIRTENRYETNELWCLESSNNPNFPERKKPCDHFWSKWWKIQNQNGTVLFLRCLSEFVTLDYFRRFPLVYLTRKLKLLDLWILKLTKKNTDI